MATGYEDLIPSKPSAQGGYEDLVPAGQIPGAGPYTAPAATAERAGEPSIAQKMAQYAAAVPGGGLVAGALKYGARGTALAPYAGRAADVLIPKSLGGLTAATGLAGATAVPAELARRQAERRGAGPTGQMLAEVGGATAGMVPVVAAYQLGSGAARTLRQAFGGEARDLGERLARTAQERAAEAAGGARAAQAQPSAELARIERAQQQLGQRGTVATQRQTGREQAVETALSDLSPSRGVLAEDLGGIIQPTGRENIRRLSGQRTQEAITKIKDPGFEAARQREAQGDFISTNPNSSDLYKQVLRELDDQISKTPEPFASELKRRLDSLRGTTTSLSGKEASYEKSLARMQGRTPNLERRAPMTLDQAEFLRRLLTDKQLGDASGFAAIDIGRRNDLAKKLVGAMEAFEPRTTQYIQKYRELSAPIEKATAGRGAALTEADLLAEQEVLFGADKQAVTRYYLDGSQERAERMLSLIGGKKPEVVNAVRGFLRSELEPMSAKQAEQFASKNEGLFRVFPEFRDSVQKVIASKKTVETAAPAAAQKAQAAEKRLELAAKGPAKTVQEQQALQRKYEGLQQSILNAAPGKEVEVSRSLAKSLYDDGLIDKVDYSNLLEQIARVQASGATTAEAKQRLRSSFIRLGWGVGGVGAAGAAGLFRF